MANLQPLLEISLNNVRLSEAEDFVIGVPVHNEISVPLVEPISCLAVGVGAAGNNVLETLVQSEPVKTLSLLARAATYRSSRITNKLLVGSTMLKGAGAQGDRNLAVNAVNADLETIKGAIAGNDLVFVIAGMAKGTGGGVGPTVARLVSEMNALPIGIAIMPFVHNGLTMAARADESFRQLQNECPAVVKFYNEAICVRHPAALSKELLDKANAAIAATVATIKEAAGSFSADGNSFADFKQHFLRGTSLLVASCMVEANASPKDQISAVLANSLTGSDITGAISSIVVLTSRKGVQFSQLDKIKVQMGAASNNIHHACSITERYDPEMPANTVRLSIICSIKGELRQKLTGAPNLATVSRTLLAENKRSVLQVSLTDVIKDRINAANIFVAEEDKVPSTTVRDSTPPLASQTAPDKRSALTSKANRPTRVIQPNTRALNR